MSRATVTMEDVAARAGVSRALVSIVMRGVPGASTTTRERVLAAARDLDYHPDTRARRLGRSRTRTLGVVFRLGHDFHDDLVDSIYLAAARADYDVVLSGVTRRHPEETAVSTLLAERCEGLLLLGSQLPAAALARLAEAVPVVSLLRPVRAAGVGVVRSDDAEGLRLTVEHLLALGHRHVAHLDGGTVPGGSARRRGFRAAMRRAGTGVVPVELPSGLREEDGAASATVFLEADGPRPTAVAAFNDRCALGFVDVVRRAGVRVPEDVSVTGFDDIAPAGYDHVRLTTVRQDVEELGSAAVEQVRARLDADEGSSDGGVPAKPSETVLPVSFVSRSTTAPPAAARGRRARRP